MRSKVVFVIFVTKFNSNRVRPACVEPSLNFGRSLEQNVHERPCVRYLEMYYHARHILLYYWSIHVCFDVLM